MEKIGIIGLGYVGLPLAIEFGKIIPVVGFDTNTDRIAELKNGHDRTLESDSDGLRSSSHLSFTSDPTGLKEVQC
jgi:UDP-N-acetyl-D-galactosamine dehydrogenase